MVGTARRAARWLVGRRARLRWVYQVLGGALLMPYFLVTLVIWETLDIPAISRSPLLLQFAAYLLALPLVAVTAFVPPVRPLEAAAVRMLLGVEVPQGPAHSHGSRHRAALWYVLHLAIGTLVAGTSLAVPPAAAVLIVMPLIGRPSRFFANGSVLDLSGAGGWAALIGLGLLVALAVLAAATGAGLARLAGVLLGPTTAERLAGLERRAAQLAERNRLARELHDSVGHALSVVTIQSGAAGRVLDRDPQFARQALAAIEKTARDALIDLDHVLGLLREEPASTAPQPTLADLHRLLTQARSAGVKVDARVGAEVAEVPPVVSREAYRIVQEGLTNALRHAGPVPVVLRVDLHRQRLEVEMTNPIAGTGAVAGMNGPVETGSAQSARRGGRGLVGVTERVAALHGRVTAGPDEHGHWRLAVEVPL